MSLFHLLKPMNMNDGVKKMKNTPGAVLLDVRTPEEYKQVHIPGSMNIPLNQLETVNQKHSDFCSLSERRKKRAGTARFKASWIYQRYQYRRYLSI